MCSYLKIGLVTSFKLHVQVEGKLLEMDFALVEPVSGVSYDSNISVQI